MSDRASLLLLLPDWCGICTSCPPLHPSDWRGMLGSSQSQQSQLLQISRHPLIVWLLPGRAAAAHSATDLKPHGFKNQADYRYVWWAMQVKHKDLKKSLAIRPGGTRANEREQASRRGRWCSPATGSASSAGPAAGWRTAAGCRWSTGQSRRGSALQWGVRPLWQGASWWACPEDGAGLTSAGAC